MQQNNIMFVSLPLFKTWRTSKEQEKFLQWNMPSEGSKEIQPMIYHFQVLLYMVDQGQAPCSIFHKRIHSIMSTVQWLALLSLWMMCMQPLSIYMTMEGTLEFHITWNAFQWLVWSCVIYLFLSSVWQCTYWLRYRRRPRSCRCLFRSSWQVRMLHSHLVSRRSVQSYSVLSY